MKQIYIVKSNGYREPVAFADRKRADAVAEMCGATVEAVRVIDFDSPCLDEWREDGGRAGI